MKYAFIILFACGSLFASRSRAQIITTVAGQPTDNLGNPIYGYSGDGGPATAATLYGPDGIAFDAAGNLYIADNYNQVIRKVNTVGIISTIAGTGAQGYSGDGGPATSAKLYNPRSIACDAAGNIYFAEYTNAVIRKIDTAGIISTVAGNGLFGFSGDGGPATAAELAYPGAVAVDAAGNIYIADEFNNRIRKVNTAGIITTIAGNGPNTNNAVQTCTTCFSGDGGPATAAQILGPRGVAVDAAGNVYIADTYNHRIRVVNSAGIINTIAGSGPTGSANYGYGGDGGPATSARLGSPACIRIDAAGNLYIGEFINYRVRRIDTAGVISTFAGSGIRGLNGDGGPATAATIMGAEDIAFDAAGNVYIADNQSENVRKVTIAPQVGIDQPLGSNGLVAVWPNPSRSGISLAIPSNEETIVVTDVLGNLMALQPYFSFSEKTKIASFDVSNLQAGVYFVRTGSVTQKFIKE